ncbi:MAG TPA: MMPL family transporter [Thermoleophilaceae bacterium]|nr:MMPL family transporter [Thermoleophilaceae bacterium]
MLSGAFFGRVVRRAIGRPVLAIALVCLLALAGAALALRADVSASIATLVDPDSESYEASEAYKDEFGDDPIAILVRGNLQRTVLTSDLGRLVALEGCLSGNVPPQGLASLPPACRELAQTRPVKVVYGPGTFINAAVTQLNEGFGRRQQQTAAAAEQAARLAAEAQRRRGGSRARQRQAADAARELVVSQFRRQILQLGIRYGLTAMPTIDNPQFVSQLVFDTSQGAGVPKARFASFFPSPNAAVIQVRLRPGLSDADRSQAIDLVERAVAAPRFRPQEGARYIVTGAPVVVDGLADAVKRSAFVLLGAVLLVMAATLALVFRARLRLVPLGVAVAAAALTFGAVSLVGGSLTMASIAALPVLIGLAVDYAIQFQARFEAARRGRESAGGRAAAGADGGGAGAGAGAARAGARMDAGVSPVRSPREAATAAAVSGGPTIASAALATAAGFLVLLLSPVPMVRGFGLILIVGIALAFVCALTAGFATLARFSERAPRPPDLPPMLPRVRAALARARERIGSTRLARGAAGRRRAFGARLDARSHGRAVAARARRAVDYAVARPQRVLAVGLALAVLGWVVDTQQQVITDVRELVPRDLPALENAATLERETGVSGELDVTVSSDRLTDPMVIDWMSRFQEQVLAANGYREGEPCGAGRSRLCPAFSLPELVRAVGMTDRADVEGLLDAIPAYFSQAVVSEDRRTASLAFGMPLMPLDEQKEVIEGIERRLERAPPGVEAAVVGLPVLAAEGNDALSSPLWRLGTLLAGLLAVFGVLLVIRRRFDRAAVPLIPIALATGWSALVLFALRIPLNPLSASLGVLILAVSTEFSVLLSARYEEEREAGAPPGEAIARTYRSTGAAVLASGATAIAGFAALTASDIRMLRDFGAVTVVDLTVSLAGVMLALPAALVWADARGLAPRDLDPRRWVPATARGIAGAARQLPGLARRAPQGARLMAGRMGERRRSRRSDARRAGGAPRRRGLWRRSRA